MFSGPLPVVKDPIPRKLTVEVADVSGAVSKGVLPFDVSTKDTDPDGAARPTPTTVAESVLFVLPTRPIMVFVGVWPVTLKLVVAEALAVDDVVPKNTALKL
jgi:hypothetical protein